MGCMTPVLINNDKLHEIRKDPESFINDIEHSMNNGEFLHWGQVHMALHNSQFKLYAFDYNRLLPVDVFNGDFIEATKAEPEHLYDVLMKAKKQIDEAINQLSGKKTDEIERRFLVHDKKVLRNLIGVDLIQGYIAGDMTIRVRIDEFNSYLTLKGPKKNWKCDEFEYEIPQSDAEELIKKYCKTKLSKTRYKIHHGDLVIEVDVFKDNLKGLIIAEVELPTEDTEFEIPSWFGREITSDHNYSNVRLAARGLVQSVKYVDGREMKCSTCGRTTCPRNGNENRCCHGWIPGVVSPEVKAENKHE